MRVTGIDAACVGEELFAVVQDGTNAVIGTGNAVATSPETGRARVAQRVGGVLIAALMVAAWWLWLRPEPLGGPLTLVTVSGISMEPGMHTGDLAVVRKADTYRHGDIIAFRVLVPPRSPPRTAPERRCRSTEASCRSSTCIPRDRYRHRTHPPTIGRRLRRGPIPPPAEAERPFSFVITHRSGVLLALARWRCPRYPRLNPHSAAESGNPGTEMVLGGWRPGSGSYRATCWAG